MMLNLYAIKDIEANTYAQPWTAPNHVVALRTCSQEVNRAHEANMIYTNSIDFELRHMGSFDCDTGEIKPENQLVANLATLKKGEEQK